MVLIALEDEDEDKSDEKQEEEQKKEGTPETGVKSEKENEKSLEKETEKELDVTPSLKEGNENHDNTNPKPDSVTIMEIQESRCDELKDSMENGKENDEMNARSVEKESETMENGKQIEDKEEESEFERIKNNAKKVKEKIGSEKRKTRPSKSLSKYLDSKKTSEDSFHRKNENLNQSNNCVSDLDSTLNTSVFSTPRLQVFDPLTSVSPMSSPKRVVKKSVSTPAKPVEISAKIKQSLQKQIIGKLRNIFTCIYYFLYKSLFGLNLVFRNKCMKRFISSISILLLLKRFFKIIGFNISR